MIVEVLCFKEDDLDDAVTRSPQGCEVEARSSAVGLVLSKRDLYIENVAVCLEDVVNPRLLSASVGCRRPCALTCFGR